MKKKVVFNFQHGYIEGVYQKSSLENAPLVIITNGHNGFYNYGMFPYIQQFLLEHGLSSYSYNFSHGGVKGDSDYFEDSDKYEKNCMRLETMDLYEIAKSLKNSDIQYNSKIKLFFLTHSLGGIPTIFAAKKLQGEVNLDGIILISTIKTLNVWPSSMIEEWKKNKVYLLKNNRTKQELPQGYEFLTEILKSDTEWNIETAIKSLDTKILILHGEKDEAVPVEHSQTLHKWTVEGGLNAELQIIPNATHTYNTKHPFEGTSNELNNMLTIVTGWIKKNL